MVHQSESPVTKATVNGTSPCLYTTTPEFIWTDQCSLVFQINIEPFARLLRFSWAGVGKVSPAAAFVFTSVTTFGPKTPCRKRLSPILPPYPFFPHSSRRVSIRWGLHFHLLVSSASLFEQMRRQSFPLKDFFF